MADQKVTIGRIVRFVDSAGVVYPAIIVKAHPGHPDYPDRQLVNLQAVHDSAEGVKWETSVPYKAVCALDPTPAYTWHWPPRE